MHHQRQLLRPVANLLLNLLVLPVARAYLRLLTLALLDKLLIALLKVVSLLSEFDKLALCAFLGLCQCLQIDEHVLIVLAQLLDLLLFHGAILLERGYLFVLLLDDEGHLLGLGFEVHQGLLRLFKLHRDGRLDRVLPFKHLLDFRLILHLFLLQLVLHLLLALLHLVDGNLLLQLLVLHLLVLEHQCLNLLVQLADDHFVLLAHDLHVAIGAVGAIVIVVTTALVLELVLALRALELRLMMLVLMLRDLKGFHQVCRRIVLLLVLV